MTELRLQISGEYDKSGVISVLENAPKFLYGLIDAERASAFDDYLATLGVEMNTYDFIVSSLDYLTVTPYNTFIVIQIDREEYIDDTDIKVIDICKLINFGNGEYKPYPIYTKIFEYLDRNIGTLYTLYG